ncbi:hypothetical protein U9M48_032750 [Paspalum notatum var. saurae]|uniref:Uncharacterized protein n=1 Tax=Paspalum notatum var. saurae TaxID=547442 RepID=A0AAQ3U9X3_PASNO
MEIVKETDGGAAPVPPAYIILYTLGLTVDWRVERFLSLCFSLPWFWPEFKKYLAEYFNRNSGADLGVEKKPEPLGRIAAEKNSLNDAANLLPINWHCYKDNQNAFQCLKKERVLLKNCVGFLTHDDLGLIHQIKQHVKQMIQ